MGCERGADGQPQLRMNVNVSDPVAKTSMNWLVDDRMPKVVHVYHFGEQHAHPLSKEEMAERVRTAQMQQPPRSESHTEKLESKSING
jgi:hypothetical protein